jgi:hypothetical protein
MKIKSDGQGKPLGLPAKKAVRQIFFPFAGFGAIKTLLFCK